MARLRIDLQIEETSQLVRQLIGSAKGTPEFNAVDPDKVVKVLYTPDSAGINEINPGIYYSIPSITTAKEGDTALSDDGRFFVYEEAGSRWFLWYTFDLGTVKIHTNNTLRGDGSLEDPLSVNTNLFSLKGDINPLLKGVDNGDGTYDFSRYDGTDNFTVYETRRISDVDALRNTAGRYDGEQVFLEGYYADHKGVGDGYFVWDSSSEQEDNGGTIIKPDDGILQDSPYLQFDGIDDTVNTDDVSALEFALPIKVDMEFIPPIASNAFVLAKYGGSSSGWVIGHSSGSFGAYIDGNNYRNISQPSGRFVYELSLEGSSFVQYINGVEVNRFPQDYAINNGATFNILQQTNTQANIYSFQVGSEVFNLDEGSGNTITGSEGTSLNIIGATWGFRKVGRWKRVHSSPVHSSWFGLIGNNTDETAKLQYFFDHIGNTNYGSAVIEGNYRISDTINIGFTGGGPYRTKVIHGSPSFNAASPMEVMIHFVNNTSLQVSGVWRVTGTTGRVYSARTPYGSGVLINNCGRSNFGGFIGLGFRDSVVAVLGGNSSVSSIGRVDSTNVGTGAPGNDWTNSLTANWSNKVNTGASNSVTQRSTIEVDVMPDDSYRSIQLCYIEGEYYEIRSKDEINSTISVYPIIPSEYTSGTLVYHYGAAVYLAGADTNVLQIGTIDAVRTGTGVDMTSLYGPNVDRMVIQNCGTAFIVGREGNASMVSYNINQLYSENNLSEFIYLVRTSIGNHNVNTIYEYDANKIKFVSRHSGWDRANSLVLNNGGRLLTYEKPSGNAWGAGNEVTIALNSPNKVITVGRDSLNVNLQPSEVFNRIFGYDTAWIAVRGSGPNNAPTGVISFRSQRSDSTYRDINGVSSSTPIEYQGSNFPGPALFVCYYRVATDDFMVDPVARILSPSEIGALGVGDKAADSDLLDGIDSTGFATAAQGALADTAVQPGDNVSGLNNDSGYVDSTGAASAAPVQSVNSKTGAVSLDADDIDDAATTNKFVTAAEKSDIASAVQPGDLATVATTGDSTDLTDSADLIRNDQDTYVSEPKVVQIITLTEAEKNAIVTPVVGALYIVPEP